jgi:Tol biopolymer transport system component
MRQHTYAGGLALVMLAVIVLLLLSFGSGAHAQDRERCFEETGYCVQDPILAYWEQNGGLDVFGYPISPLQEQTIEGSWTGPVQWFERDRLEDHSADGEGVLAGRLGASILELRGTPWTSFPQVESAPQGCRFFPETKHALCPPFLSYWQNNGGLERFGYPITEMTEETIGTWNGNVQYFERRRMEHRPENAGTRYEVLLGLLGKEVLSYEPTGMADTSGNIVFTSTAGGKQDIWTMNADGSSLRRITSDPDRQGFQPAWSPDGKQIAYVAGTPVTQDQDIWIINADGSGARKLTDNPTADWSPDWSPDGKHIIYVSDRSGNADIFYQPADRSGEATNLTTFSPEASEYSPAWSPDGSRIAYVSTEGNGTPNIWVLTLDGRDRYNLTQEERGTHNNPAWSADNSRIAFDAGYSDESVYIGIINVDRTARQNIPRAYDANHPSWSPSGASLAYESGGDIFTINLDGTGYSNLTGNSAANNRDPDWH